MQRETEQNEEKYFAITAWLPVCHCET